MKWIMTNLFHRGQYEYGYSHIGMGSHNLELLACLHPANSLNLYQLFDRLETVGVVVL